MIVSRILLLLVAVAAAYVASTRPADILSMVAWAFSIAAAGIFPALTLGVWWKRATAQGAIAGMILGYGVCAYDLVGTTTSLSTLLIGGIPAALSERLRPLHRSTSSSLGIWAACVALLAAPTLLGLGGGL